MTFSLLYLLGTMLASLPVQDGQDAQPRAGAALLPLVVQAELHQEIHGRFEDAVFAGLSRGNTEVVRVPAARPCSDRACWQRLGQQHRAEFLVVGQLVVVDHDYRFFIRLIDGVEGTELGSSAETCEVCSVAEATTMVSRQASALWSKVDAIALVPARLAIRSEPAGAQIELDGRSWGRTPTERELAAGRHRTRVSLDGFAAQELEVFAVPGVREELLFRLTALPRRDRTRPLRIAGWTTLGVGLAATAVGTMLLVLHGRDDRRRCSGRDVDADGDCRFRFETLAGGATTLSVGLSAVIVGSVVLGVARARRRRAR